MKAALFFFLKLFIYAGLVYGGTQFVMLYFFGTNQNYAMPLISGLGLGFMMALIFTISQILSVKKLRPGNLSIEKLSLHQVAHLQVPLTKEQIIARLKNSYPSKDWELLEEADAIKLKTSFSAYSFGEKVTLKVNQLQEGISEVLMESRPKTWFTLVDYGKNLKNIIYLQNLLTTQTFK